MGAKLHNRFSIPYISPLVKHKIGDRAKLFSGPHISRIISPRGAYTGKICEKGGAPMDPEYIHGDVDDMIYQEEWSASER